MRLHLGVLGRNLFILLAARRLRMLQVDVGLAELVRAGLRKLAVDQWQVDLILGARGDQCPLVILV